MSVDIVYTVDDVTNCLNRRLGKAAEFMILNGIILICGEFLFNIFKAWNGTGWTIMCNIFMTVLVISYTCLPTYITLN